MKTYEPLHDGFVRFCSSRAYGLMDTGDLVQESLLACYEQFDQVRNNKALLAYLMRIAVNIVNSKLRRKKFSSEYDEEAFSRILKVAPNAEVAADVSILYRAIRKLPEKQRRAIELFEVSGFSLSDCAEILNISEGAVKQSLHRGRKTLRETLGPDKKSLTKTLYSISLLI